MVCYVTKVYNKKIKTSKQKSTKLNFAVKLAIVFLFVFFAHSSYAQDYYISNSGNDINPGTSQVNPWKTIAKVNSSQFNPGDRILFKKGEMWQESLILKNSGTSEKPIFFGTYGQGSRPKLELGFNISNLSWQVYKGSIYVADAGFDVQTVYIDGKFMNISHYPNQGNLYTDSGGSYWFIDNALNYTTSQLIGAEAIMQTSDWTREYVKIINYEEVNHKISIDGTGNSVYPIDSNEKYILTNKLWMLDEPGEWYFDQATSKIYIWTDDSLSPAEHSTIASRYDNGIFGESTHNIIVDGFEISHAAHSGIYFRKSNNLIIKNNEIHDIGTFRWKDIWNYDGNGIYLWDSENGDFANNKALIEDNTINNVLRKGIFRIRYRNIEIARNTISNIGNFELPSVGVGIFGGEYIHHNSIQNTSYNGIQHGSTNNYADILVEYNYVNDTCNSVFDGGGIYQGAISGVKRIVKNNVVENTGNDLSDNTFAIYLDGSANNIDVINNTVIYSNRGIFIHTGDNNNILENTVYNCKRPLSTQRDSLTLGTTLNNLWKNNIGITFDQLGYPVYNTNYKDGLYESASYSGNIYSSPNSSRVIYEQYKNGGKSVANTYSLPEWKQTRNQDLDSVFIEQTDSNPSDSFQILVNKESGMKSFSYEIYGKKKIWKYLDGSSVQWPVSIAEHSSKVIMAAGAGVPSAPAGLNVQ